MHVRYFLSLLVLLALPAYCLDDADAHVAGIWHTEVDDRGLRAAFKFEIRPDTESGEWRGRWEMLERIAWGDLQAVTVDDVSVVVSLDDGTRFEGVLTSEGTTLEGRMYSPSGESPMTFSKVDNWATQMTARTDAQGGAVKSWTYSVPEKLDDGWRVASLSAEEVDDLGNLFQKVIDGRYRGLDAMLITRGGDLVVEEYFHFGSRDEIHTLQSVTKSVTSLLLGISHDQGLIDDLDKPLYQYFASDYPDALWVKDEYPITLRHALTMSAGLDWHEEGIPYTESGNDNTRMNRSGDMYGYVLSRELASDKQPGDEFAYTRRTWVLNATTGALAPVRFRPAAGCICAPATC